MKLHPLHSPEMIMDYMLNTGEYWPQERCTGRSTALALEYLAKAIRNPGVRFHVRDHHDSTVAHRCLATVVRDFAIMLGLEHMQFTGGTIMFGAPK